jgi:hypothetical protein
MKNYTLIPLLIVNILLSTPLFAGKHNVTGKTFFKQANNLLWHQPSMPSGNPAHKNITTTGVAQAYYFESAAKKKLGNYFGYHDSGTDTTHNSIGVAAPDDTLMKPQDIIHDADNAADYNDAAVNPLKQTITYNPSISQTALVLGTRTQFGQWACLEVLLPWESRSHSMGLVISNTVKQTVEGKAVTLLDYLQGSVQQIADDNAKNKQVPLAYSKLKNKQTVEGLADLLINLSIRPLLDDADASDFALGFSLRLPTTDGAHGEYLFEPLQGSGGHTLVGFSASWSHAIASLEKHLSLRLGGSISHNIGISRHETRSPNIALFDGSAARFSRFNLAGKQNTQRLIPFPNILTQQVSVTPGSCTDIRLQAQLRYRWLDVTVGYHFAHSNGERVSLVGEWPGTVYGKADFVFEADGDTGYETFQVASHSATLDGSYSSTALAEDRLLFDAAATPAQTTHGLCFGLEAHPTKLPHTHLFCRGAYHFALRSSFGLEGVLLSAGLAHQF